MKMICTSSFCGGEIEVSRDSGSPTPEPAFKEPLGGTILASSTISHHRPLQIGYVYSFSRVGFSGPRAGRQKNTCPRSNLMDASPPAAPGPRSPQTRAHHALGAPLSAAGDARVASGAQEGPTRRVTLDPPPFWGPQFTALVSRRGPPRSSLPVEPQAPRTPNSAPDSPPRLGWKAAAPGTATPAERQGRAPPPPPGRRSSSCRTETAKVANPSARFLGDYDVMLRFESP